jgi:hypothetical protein
MDQDAINQAVQLCVQRSIASPDPLSAMKDYLTGLGNGGWSEAEVVVVRNAATRMLARILGTDADKAE